MSPQALGLGYSSPAVPLGRGWDRGKGIWTRGRVLPRIPPGGWLWLESPISSSVTVDLDGPSRTPAHCLRDLAKGADPCNPTASCL